MNLKLLRLIEKDARISVSDMATMLGMTESEVEAAIKELEADGVICGYRGVIDWSKIDSAKVSAIIELKVMPKAGLGFEEVAERIAKYPEVESVSLMSGAYDLNVVVKGKTFQEIAMFVAKELAVIDSVTSTATQFVMRRYKECGVELVRTEEDGRGNILL